MSRVKPLSTEHDAKLIINFNIPNFLPKKVIFLTFFHFLKHFFTFSYVPKFTGRLHYIHYNIIYIIISYIIKHRFIGYFKAF